MVDVLTAANMLDLLDDRFDGPPTLNRSNGPSARLLRLYRAGIRLDEWLLQVAEAFERADGRQT